MTLAQRHALIDRTVRWVEKEYPPMTTRSMLDVVVAHLAIREGITTTPEEVTRVLSQLAQPLA